MIGNSTLVKIIIYIQNWQKIYLIPLYDNFTTEKVALEETLHEKATHQSMFKYQL